jgi:hypothetical protein
MALRTEDRLAVRVDRSPSAGVRLLGILFAVLALSAGMISLLINISFGLQSSVVAAAVFGLSDGAKILLPMAAVALGGWNLRRRLAWLIAVAISVAAALSSLLEDETARIQASKVAASAASAAQADETNARQELAGIREPLPAAVLQRLADDAGAEAAREEASGGCGERCRTQKGRRSEYLARLGLAERRDALQSQLVASAGQPANSEFALGAADALAALVGGDKFRIATMITLALSIAMLLILELLASLSGDAAMLLAKTANGRISPTETATAPQAAGKLIAKPIKVVSNRAYYLARLEHGHPQLAAQVHRGELSVHKAAIQAGLRKAPARRSEQAAAKV